MANTAVGAEVTNELAIQGGSYVPGAQHVLQISTAPSEHLLFASNGSLFADSPGFRAPASSLDLDCAELTAAWSGAEATRNVTWTAPAAGTGAVSFTLAAAPGYGPVTIYVFGVEEGEAPPATTSIAPGVDTTTSATSSAVGLQRVAWTGWGLLLAAASFAGQ